MAQPQAVAPGAVRACDRPEYVDDAGRFEIGALPMPGVFALDASIRLLLEIGNGTIARRIGAVLSLLEDGLPKTGWEPVLHGQEVRSGILAARPPAGIEAHRAMRHLEANGVACSARAGFLRLSPHVANEPDDAARVLDLLARL